MSKFSPRLPKVKDVLVYLALGALGAVAAVGCNIAERDDKYKKPIVQQISELDLKLEDLNAKYAAADEPLAAADKKANLKHFSSPIEYCSNRPDRGPYERQLGDELCGVVKEIEENSSLREGLRSKLDTVPPLNKAATAREAAGYTVLFAVALYLFVPGAKGDHHSPKEEKASSPQGTA